MKKLFTAFILMFAFMANAQLQVFTTINSRADLYNYSTISHNRVIAAIGISSPWDSPTEFWTFDSSSMAVDDGIKVIRPNDILVGSAGRFLWKSNLVKQYGTIYAKEWNGSLTTATNTAVFDISSAGFVSLVGIQAFAILSSGTVLNLPLSSISVTPTNTSITINLLESKTTNTLLISSAEGLETHAASGTIVYLTVKGN